MAFFPGASTLKHTVHLGWPRGWHHTHTHTHTHTQIRDASGRDRAGLEATDPDHQHALNRTKSTMKGVLMRRQSLKQALEQKEENIPKWGRDILTGTSCFCLGPNNKLRFTCARVRVGVGVSVHACRFLCGWVVVLEATQMIRM